MKRVAIIIALATAAIFSGCRPPRNDSSSFEFIDKDGWAYGDTIIYDLELADSVATGALTLSLRHTNDYLYCNLWLEVTVEDSIGARVDTLNVAMADAFGRWYGRGIGTDFQVTDTISPAISLRRPARVKVRHVMRVDRLADIEQIGVVFDERER